MKARSVSSLLLSFLRFAEPWSRALRALWFVVAVGYLLQFYLLSKPDCGLLFILLFRPVCFILQLLLHARAVRSVAVSRDL